MNKFLELENIPDAGSCPTMEAEPHATEYKIG